MMRTIGLGNAIASATIPARPRNHIHGAIAAIARPPSSGTTGSRLKRFRKKPVNASAVQKSWPPTAATTRQAAAPGAGGPDAPRAQRLPAQRLAQDAAPHKGDKQGRRGLAPLGAQRNQVA